MPVQLSVSIISFIVLFMAMGAFFLINSGIVLSGINKLINNSGQCKDCLANQCGLGEDDLNKSQTTAYVALGMSVAILILVPLAIWIKFRSG